MLNPELLKQSFTQQLSSPSPLIKTPQMSVRDKNTQTKCLDLNSPSELSVSELTAV